MKNSILQGLRKALFLDVADAAEFIGGVTKRSWQYWEAGDKPVPEDVAKKILVLTDYANKAFESALKEGSEYVYSYYEYDDFKERFGDNVVKWKMYQSVLTRLYATLGDPLTEVPAPEDCALYMFFNELTV